MSAPAAADGGALVARPGGVRVWDPLVRIAHWTIALAVLLNGVLLDPETALHRYIGYVVLAVLAIRLVWGVVGFGAARFSAFPPNLPAAFRQARSVLGGRPEIHLSHNPLGALMVYNIWATLAGIVTTGIMMGTVTFFGVEWVEEVHEALANWLLISVALHVIGVIVDQRLTGVGLVRAMITGIKRGPSKQ